MAQNKKNILMVLALTSLHTQQTVSYLNFSSIGYHTTTHYSNKLQADAPDAITDSLGEWIISHKARTAAIIASIMLCGSYIYDAAFVTEKDFVKENFPYAQQWLDAMIQKYPKADFDNCWFIALEKPETPLKDCRTLEEEEAYFEKWKSYHKKIRGPLAEHGNIKYPYYMLEQLNTTYKKVVENQSLSPEETTFLKKQEWLLLHTARSKKLNSFTTKLALVIGGALAVDQSSKDPVNRRLAGTALLLPFLAYCRWNNEQDDTYANILADHDALEGGLAYLQEDTSNFVSSFATAYNEHEEQALYLPYKTNALKPHAKMAQALYHAVHTTKKYSTQAFFTAMKPVKYLCSKPLCYQAFNLLFNPIQPSKEERIAATELKMK